MFHYAWVTNKNEESMLYVVRNRDDHLSSLIKVGTNIMCAGGVESNYCLNELSHYAEY